MMINSAELNVTFCELKQTLFLLRESSPEENYNRGIKLIGIFGWCQMTLFFTYCPLHALHVAQITSK